jgi:hypothetical protein
MLTSLAPSPMAKVQAVTNFYLTNPTISAFCLGDTLHAMTTLVLSVSSKN